VRGFGGHSRGGGGGNEKKKGGLEFFFLERVGGAIRKRGLVWAPGAEPQKKKKPPRVPGEVLPLGGETTARGGGARKWGEARAPGRFFSRGRRDGGVSRETKPDGGMGEGWGGGGDGMGGEVGGRQHGEISPFDRNVFSGGGGTTSFPLRPSVSFLSFHLGLFPGPGLEFSIGGPHFFFFFLFFYFRGSFFRGAVSFFSGIFVHLGGGGFRSWLAPHWPGPLISPLFRRRCTPPPRVSFRGWGARGRAGNISFLSAAWFLGRGLGWGAEENFFRPCWGPRGPKRGFSQQGGRFLKRLFAGEC